MGRGGGGGKDFSQMLPARTSYASLMTLKRSSAFLGLSLFLSGCHLSAWRERATGSRGRKSAPAHTSVFWMFSLRSSRTGVRSRDQQDQAPLFREHVDKLSFLQNTRNVEADFRVTWKEEVSETCMNPPPIGNRLVALDRESFRGCATPRLGTEGSP